jgi:hypothetical protein
MIPFLSIGSAASQGQGGSALETLDVVLLAACRATLGAFDTSGAARYKERVTESARGTLSRRRVALLVLAAAVVVLVAVVLTIRYRTAAEDCEDKPPPNAFAVASCDEPAGGTAAKP